MFNSSKSDSATSQLAYSIESMYEMLSEAMVECEQLRSDVVSCHYVGSYNAIKYNDSDIMIEALHDTQIHVSLLCSRYISSINFMKNTIDLMYKQSKKKYVDAVISYNKKGLLNTGKVVITNYDKSCNEIIDNFMKFCKKLDEIIKKITILNDDVEVSDEYSKFIKSDSGDGKILSFVKKENITCKCSDAEIFKGKLTKKIADECSKKEKDFNTIFMTAKKCLALSTKMISAVEDSFKRIPELYAGSIVSGSATGVWKEYNTLYLAYFDTCSTALDSIQKCMQRLIHDFIGYVEQSKNVLNYASNDTGVFLEIEVNTDDIQ